MTVPTFQLHGSQASEGNESSILLSALGINTWSRYPHKEQPSKRSEPRIPGFSWVINTNAPPCKVEVFFSSSFFGDWCSRTPGRCFIALLCVSSAVHGPGGGRRYLFVTFSIFSILQMFSVKFRAATNQKERRRSCRVTRQTRQVPEEICACIITQYYYIHSSSNRTGTISCRSFGACYSQHISHLFRSALKLSGPAEMFGASAVLVVRDLSSDEVPMVH